MIRRHRRAVVPIGCAGLLLLSGCGAGRRALVVSESFRCDDRPVTEPELERQLSRLASAPAPEVLGLDAGGLRARIADGLNIRCLLDGLDERPPPALSIASSRDRGGWIERRVILRDDAAGDVRALLLLPKNAPQPRPAVVGLHGHGDSARVFAKRYLGYDLAARGHVVLLPEFDFLGENEASLRLLRRGGTLMGLRAYQTLLMINYLRSLPEVDPRSIAMISHSGGSSAANLVARLTDRVAAQVSDYEVDYRGTNEAGMRGVHCETVPALYPLSATINDETSLKIPRLNVEYGFNSRPAREKILDFLARPYACSTPHPAAASSCVDQAEWALDKPDRDAALRHLNLALRAKPGRADLFRIARLCRRLGEDRLFLSVAALLDDGSSLSPAFQLERAEAAARAGDRALALESLEKAEEPRPDPERLHAAAGLYRRLDEPGRASKALEALARLRPGSFALRLERADAALAAGDRALALRALEGTAAAKAGLEDLRRLEALYRRLEEPRRALTVSSALVLLRPGEAGLWLERAHMALRAGERAAALESLSKVVELDAKEDELRRAAGLYQRLGEPRLALKALDALVRESPLRAGFWLERAETAASLGEKAAALESLARVESLAADEDERRRTAGMYRTLEEPRLAVRALGALLRSSPKDAGLWLERADAALRAGEAAAARESLREAYGSARTDADRRRVARGYQELKDYRRAAGILRRLARRSPRSAGLLSDLGVCEHLAGLSREAVVHLNRAISLEPRSLPAYLTLGAIYRAGGRARDALRIYDAALDAGASPGSEELLELVRRSRGELLAAARPAPPAP